MNRRTLALLFIANTLGGCAPALFFWLGQPDAGFGYFLEQARFGLVYAWCIGPLCFLVAEGLALWIRSRLPRGWHIPAFTAALAVLAAAGSVPASLLLVLFGWIPPRRLWTVYRYGAQIAVAFTMVIGGLIMAFEILRHRLDAATIELRDRQLAEERDRQVATEVRLRSLESRVHPHFLFNTLNSIGALIREDPVTAERTVERLAALLRESFDMDHARLVPLRRELRVVEDYLEIERTRYAGRLRYRIDVPSGFFELEVPPFCLQTLVENSVKHVVSARREGAEIHVRARLENGSVTLEVSDDGPGFDAASVVPGHGLDNLQGRLAALFDGAARLNLGRRDGRASVAFSIPLGKV